MPQFVIDPPFKVSIPHNIYTMTQNSSVDAEYTFCDLFCKILLLSLTAIQRRDTNNRDNIYNATVKYVYLDDSSDSCRHENQ